MLVYGIIQVLIVFQGTLNSWWTRIVIGFLVFLFCLLQRLFESKKKDGGRQERPRGARGGSGGAMSERAATSSASSPRLSDPPERWEIDCGVSAVSVPSRGLYDVFPHTPRRAEDLPKGALETLNRGCSLEGLEQLFVISAAVRSIGWGRPEGAGAPMRPGRRHAGRRAVDRGT